MVGNGSGVFADMLILRSACIFDLESGDRFFTESEFTQSIHYEKHDQTAKIRAVHESQERVMRNRMKFIGLFCAEHGATAVEYALIGGLLGLGLVGALVTTKSSLNSDYTKIATHVGGGDSTPVRTLPLAEMAQYWSSKTLNSKVVTNYSNAKETVYRYSDGSLVVAYIADSDGSINLTTKDASKMEGQSTFLNGIGQLYYADITSFSKPAMTPGDTLKTIYFYNDDNSVFSGNPPAPSRMLVQNYGSNSVETPITEDSILKVQSGIASLAYFKALSK